MIGFCPLASGSKGNCLYVGSTTTRLLIDAGLSGRATEQRLASLGIGLETIQGILITHEHHDHIAGLKQLAIRREIPVYANADTAKGILRALRATPKHLHIFTTGDPFWIGDIAIRSVPTLHDTLDPVAFTLEYCGRRLGVCTDLGAATPHVVSALQGCHHLIVEANHDPQLVAMSARPVIYKQRVLGPYGHLSNEACHELVRAVSHCQLRSIHLAHLSEECNRPELALEALQPLCTAHGYALHLAHQAEVSAEVAF